MRKVTAEDDRPHLRQLDQQAVVPRRVARGIQHDHGAIAEDILVLGHDFDGAAAADPVRDQLRVYPAGGFGLVRPSQSPLPISRVAFGSEFA